MKIARLATLLGITLATLGILVVPARRADADTYCGEGETVIVCCTWSGNELVGCYRIPK